MRAIVVQPWRWGVALAVVLAVAARPAAAQSTLIQADGVVNAGYTQTTRSVFQADPKADAPDVKNSSVGGAFTELRPTITFQGGSPRVTWRAGYTFSANFSLGGTQGTSYGNQANGALVAELTQDTMLTFTAALAQGGTAFLLSQPAAQDGKPAIRAQGNPSLVSGTVTEALSWQAGRHLAFKHNLNASLSAPQDDLSQSSTAVAAAFSLEQLFTRDTLGLELHLGVAWLRPQRLDEPNYASVTNALLARWNHDFSVGWNGLATAGMEQVFTDTGSRPLAFLPTGSLSVRYTAGTTAGGLELSHGTATNLQVGAVSITDRLAAHAVITLDERKLRAFSFSAGILHNQPIGEVSPEVLAATGNAVQVDAGFATQLAKNLLLVARYSAAYQFDQGGGLGATLAHIALVGVSGTWSNSEKARRPLPHQGDRVDGGDSEGFRVVPDAPEPEQGR